MADDARRNPASQRFSARNRRAGTPRLGPAPGAREALGFLTVVGQGTAPSPAAVVWFPVVGALLGLALGGLWMGAARLWPPAVAAAVVVTADLVLTGMLHFDGFVDAADGLLAPLDRGRRLAAMADPGIGAFGLGAGVGVILLRWTSLSALAVSPVLLAGLWGASRTVMAITLWWGRPARPGGLSAAFVSPAKPGRVAVVAGSLAGATVLGWLGAGRMGLVAVAGALLAAWAVLVLARRRLGGFTGDVLGAAGLVGETVGLVLAAARW